MYHSNISVRPQLLYSKSIAIGNKNISKLIFFFFLKITVQRKHSCFVSDKLQQFSQTSLF